ncbi:MAG: DUF484 family protein [Gammaproteobacteria bacterium]
MSTQRQPTPENDTLAELTDETVIEYLEAHDDFFAQHPELLAALKLPHQTGGAAVSLVERQVSILRQRNGKLERKLSDLMAIAHSNDALSGKLHAMSLMLMRAPSLRALVSQLEEGLRVEFGADQTTLILFNDNVRYPGTDEFSFVRCVGARSDRLKPFRTFLDAARPRCGQMRDAQRAFLFGNDNLHIGSTALVPLGDASQIGILAIGSKDATHFHPGMGTDFMARLGDVMGVALEHHAVGTAAA